MIGLAREKMVNYSLESIFESMRDNLIFILHSNDMYQKIWDNKAYK